MYQKKVYLEKTSLKINDSFVGETIEQKVRRVTRQNEPITDGAQRIYTERKDGVRPEYDIRTDRFELATEATDYMTKSKLAERATRLEALKGGGGEANSVQATGTDTP